MARLERATGEGHGGDDSVTTDFFENNGKLAGTVPDLFLFF